MYEIEELMELAEMAEEAAMAELGVFGFWDAPEAASNGERYREMEAVACGSKSGTDLFNIEW